MPLKFRDGAHFAALDGGGYTPQTGTSSVKQNRDQDPPVVNEPRLYGNPF